MKCYSSFIAKHYIKYSHPRQTKLPLSLSTPNISNGKFICCFSRSSSELLKYFETMKRFMSDNHEILCYATTYPPQNNVVSGAHLRRLSPMIKYSEKGNFPEWKLKMKIYCFNV